MGFTEEKLAFNDRAKASMREFLRSKTWEEKVESIELRGRRGGRCARPGAHLLRLRKDDLEHRCPCRLGGSWAHRP